MTKGESVRLSRGVFHICTLAAGLLSLPAVGGAVDLGITSDTIVRHLERDDRNGISRSLLPAYEFFRFDYGKLRTPGLSLHAYGWGRVNLEDNYYNHTTAGELLYAYLEYLDPARDYQLRLGRQYIFEGVTKESIDGVYGKTDLIPSVTVSAYSGFPVNLDDTNGRSGDLIAGCRVAQGIPGYYDIAVSYKNVRNDGKADEELLGTDVTLMLPGNITVLGHSTRNLLTGGWGEHSYELRVPFRSFEVRPFYQHYEYDSFLNKNAGGSSPFRFLATSGDEMTVVGSEAFWYPVESIEVGARYKHYEYDPRFGRSNMYTVLATVRRQIFSEVGAEFGRVEGDLSENRYYYGRAYIYADFRRLFVTGDVVYARYDEAIYRKDGALFASVGLGGKVLDPSFKLKFSVDYSDDPYFDKDYRGTLVASYSFGN